MNTISPLCILILAAYASAVQAELVTSTINLNIMTVPFTASAAAGPVEDQQLTTLNGQQASSGTSTSGITYVTIPKYPGRVFVVTGSFAVWSTALLRPNPLNIGKSSVDSGVRRDGRWRFDAISSPLLGTGGSFQMTFRISRSAIFSIPYDWVSTQTALDFYKTNGAVQSVALFDNNGASGSQSDTQLFTTTRIPFERFGQTFDYFWRVKCAAQSSSFNGEAKSSMVTELLQLTVFDAIGNHLTRFVDYEWYEEIGNQSGGFNAWSVASGEMIDPTTSIRLAASGNPEITYTGLLQESNDLSSWNDVVPQPAWRFELTPSPPTTKFFRSRTP